MRSHPHAYRMRSQVRGVSDIVRSFVRIVIDNPEDDIMGALISTMASKAAGKDIAIEAEGVTEGVGVDVQLHDSQ